MRRGGFRLRVESVTIVLSRGSFGGGRPRAAMTLAVASEALQGPGSHIFGWLPSPIAEVVRTWDWQAALVVIPMGSAQVARARQLLERQHFEMFHQCLWNTQVRRNFIQKVWPLAS